MQRQGSWIKDFLYGVRLAWRSAWMWRRVYRLERSQAERLKPRTRV